MDNTKIASNPLHNVWISASAGSGKTKLLTDRVLRLLLSGVEPAKILCLTYTKAAAAEMMHRITTELSKWIVLDNTALENALTLLTGAVPNGKVIDFAKTLLIRILDTKNSIKVQTIHSYCQTIINKFPIEAGVSLQAEILDEQQKQVLLAKAIHNLLSDCDNSKYFALTLKPILNNIHEFSFLALVEDALLYRQKLGDIMQSDGDVLWRVFDRLGVDYNSSLEEIFKDFILNFDQVFKSYKNIIKTALLEQDVDFLRILAEFAAADFDKKKELYHLLYESFYTAAHTPRKTLLSSKLIKQYNLENCLTEICLIVEQYVEKSNSYKIAQNTSGFVYLVYLIQKYYTELKQANMQLDYDDLINITLKLFDSEQLLPWIMFKLDTRVEHVLIDESQDISLEQWRIINVLTNNFFYDMGEKDLPRTVFVVGDQKQSIFSFQGADPKLFNQMKNQYQQFITEFSGELYLIDLVKSYRSGESILQVVDAVFNYLNQKNPGAFIEGKSKHIAHKTNMSSRVELWMPVLGKQDEPKKDFSWDICIKRKEIYDPARILAGVISNNIKHWLATDKTLKPVDIMILIRKRDRFTEYLVRALKDNDIPVSGLDRIKMNDNIVIKDLLALANFILLPCDDYNLAVLLKSPIIDLSEDELFNLSQRADNSLWNNLKILSINNLKLFEVYEFLNSFLRGESFQNLPIYGLYSSLLNLKGIRKKFISRFGLQINEIIDEFLNICIKFEQKNTSSLQQFVQWFSSSNIEVKRETDNKVNAVRVMTVHAAKGLQAKRVILADNLNVPRVARQVIWSEELGLPLYNGGAGNNNEIYRKTLLQSETQKMQEYYRLLYVAMTRAEEYLIVCGWSSGSSVSENSWYNVVRGAVEKIGYSEACTSFGGYDIIINKEPASGSYFYSDTVSKFIVENITDSVSIRLTGLEKREEKYDLPEFIWQKSKIVADHHLSPSTNIFSKFVRSPLDTVANINMGTLIHKVLEISMCSADRTMVTALIKRYAQDYHLKINDEIISKVQSLICKLHDLSPVNAKILPEASIAGKINGVNIHGMIDLLIVTESEVKIIDYKTSSFADVISIPEQYIAQLAIYKKLVSGLYAGKQIKCYIVSVIDGKFFELSQEELEKYSCLSSA